MTKIEEAIQAITLYHDLASEADTWVVYEVAARLLRKAVKAGRAQITSTPVVLLQTAEPKKQKVS